jgi:hypothetical protein
MTQPRMSTRFRCRFCGTTLPACLPVPQVLDGAMLLGHLSHRHPEEIGPLLEQMRTTEDMSQVAVQACAPPADHGRRLVTSPSTGDTP